MPSANVEIADFGGLRTLIVEQFDRRWTDDKRLIRLPQEDCCQALSVPPTRKYQSDGGPGIRDILELLKGSDRPISDIATFLRASIVFWLIGATDGHAKNFSVFLGPGGRFSMTPLYDVLTAQPSLDANQIRRNRFKLAMSVGTNRHYAVADIMPRHFIQTADDAAIAKSLVQTIFDDLTARASKMIDTVIDALPANYPASVADSVKHGVSERLRLFDAAVA